MAARESIDDHLFVVGGHENREVGDGEDPAVSGGEGRANETAVSGSLTDHAGAEGPVRRGASVPRKAPEPVQRAVHDPEESDRRPEGEVDAEDEREHQPDRDHEKLLREPVGESSRAARVSRPRQQPHGRLLVASQLRSRAAST